MAKFTLDEVLTATNGIVLKKQREDFSSVVTDTRGMETGALFVALVGERFDGHAFARQAAKAGASGIVVGKDFARGELAFLSATVVRVEDTLKAYQDLARFHRARYNIPVIAVTGSTGKTTTKDLIAAALSSKYRALKTEANFNNEIGLPKTLLQLGPEHDAAVVEMGMRGLGQIKALAEIARPTVGAVTNVNETHIELLGSIENIAEAKSELVEAIGAGGVVILNADDPRVLAMRGKASGKVRLFGLNCAELGAERIRMETRGMTFLCRGEGWTEEIQLRALGRHNVHNALCAIAAALELGLCVKDIRAGLARYEPADMRLNVKVKGEYVVINDAYNASPASMAAAIDTLASTAKKRAVAVLGDMLELGGHAPEAHRRIGVLLAEKKIDLVVAVGRAAQWIADAARDGGIAEVYACRTGEEAGGALRSALKPGDTILFKGSRGMRMERIIALI